MSFGNTNDNNNQNINAPWQRAMMKLLKGIQQSSSGVFLTSDQTITGTTLTIPQTPVFIYGVYLNGQKLTLITDYSVVANVITFVNSLSADLVSVVYKI